MHVDNSRLISKDLFSMTIGRKKIVDEIEEKNYPPNADIK